MSGGFRSGGGVADGFAVGGEGLSGGGFLLVEDFVEEDDLAGDLVVTKGLEFVEGVDGDDVGGEAVGGSGSAVTERGEGHLLWGVGNHSGIFGECGGLGAKKPGGGRGLLEADFGPPAGHVGGPIFGAPRGRGG